MKKLLLSAVALLVTQLLFAQLKPVSYRAGKQELKGLINTKPQSPKGAVLLLPAWMGIDEEAKSAALALQKEGYLVLIADIYGEGNYPKDGAEAGKLASFYKTDYVAYQLRIKAALETLIAQGAAADKIVVMGYCFGGTGALEAARAQLPVKAVISVHGGLSKGSRPAVPLHSSILVLHGADDNNVPKAEVEAFMEEVKTYPSDWQLIYYANSKHTFTNVASKDYNELMAKRAFQHILLFLEEQLP